MTSLADLDPNPFVALRRWYGEALEAGVPDPDAMTLATATRDGRPSARIVLLKGVDDGGLVFYSNYRSRKGRELAENPRAALVLFWPTLRRQVRLEGTVSTTSEAESDEYFRTRPRGSRIGAWASEQSVVIESRDALEARAAEVDRQYAGSDIPRPPHWGGYRLVPSAFEFWISRPNRLHDRFLYTRSGSGWARSRLSP